MNTKIIYISGGEVFDMGEIRAAFDEVRTALGLDKNTVLFGVPVDCDDALATTTNRTIAPETTAVAIETNEIIENEAIIDTLSEQEIDTTPQETEIIEEPVEIIPQAVETEPDELETAAQDSADQDKPIPILSVLAAKEVVAEPVATEIVEEEVATIEEEIVPQAEIEPEPEQAAKEDTDAQKVSIEDMIDEEAPTAPVEKTLEQLLESMTPLREDHGTDAIAAEPEPEGPDDFMGFEDDSTDATLAQLASEFAETQDKIPTAPKAENHGKIGKLKNILPFKKLKRDDNGLMGDLFGWAGIAANDEEFSIPGFFTNAAGKK